MAGRYKPYAEYKDSGVEWLGIIPKSWSCIRLKYSVDLNGNRTEVGSMQRYVGMENIESGNGRYLAKEDVSPEGLSTSFLKGDVLFGKLRPYLAKSWLAEFSGICSSEFLVLRSKNVSPGFLHYYTLTDEFISQVDASTYGSKMPRASWDFIGLLPVPIPDNGSEKISNFLDHETAKIDTLIEKQQQLIQLLKEKRQAVISHAVTKGLNPNAKMRDSGVEWLGDVPEHWNLSQPRYVCSFVGGGTPAKENSEFWNGNIPWVSPKDMKQDYISTAQDKITPAAVSQSAVKLINAGAILIVVRGMILDHSVPVALSEAELTINQDMKALIPNEQLNGEYLLYCLKGLRDSILNLVESSAHGTKCLRTEQFDRMVLPLPPLVEQLEIISRIKDALGHFDKLILSTEIMVELATERRTALISAAVTGKIDVRDWVAPQANQPSKEVAA